MTDEELNQLERESTLQVLKARIEFAKFGFKGTLVGACGSIVAVLLLALIDGWQKVSLHSSVYVSFIVGCVIAVIAFGFFSLWSLPEITADIVQGRVAFGRRAPDEAKRKAEEEARAAAR